MVGDVDEIDVRMPSGPSTLTSCERVEPYTAFVATMRSPACTSDTSEAWIAAIPELRTNARLGRPRARRSPGASAAVVGLSTRL